MKKTLTESIPSKLRPMREDYLNSQQLVTECQKANIPISRKSLHNYIKDGLLPKPLHVAKEALFHKDFVMGQIEAIHVLKSLFHVRHNDMKKLASNKYVDLHYIVTAVYSMLSNLQENNTGKAKERPLLVNIANEEFLQGVVALFLDDVSKGIDPRQIDMEKFVRKAFDIVKA